MERAFKRLRCVGTGIVFDIPSPCNDNDDTNAKPAGLRCEGTGPVINIPTPCNNSDDANAKPAGLRCKGTGPVINIPTLCNNNDDANAKPAGLRCEDTGSVINRPTPCNDNDDTNAELVGLRCEGTGPVINIPTPCSNNNNLANTKSADIKLVDLGNNDEEDARRTQELLLERIAGYESIRAEVDFLLGRGPPCNDGKGKGVKAKVTLHECQVISHTELSRICSEAADSDTQAAEQKKAQDDDIDLDADTLPMGA
jgi:hypothetical protein